MNTSIVKIETSPFGPKGKTPTEKIEMTPPALQANKIERSAETVSNKSDKTYLYENIVIYNGGAREVAARSTSCLLGTAGIIGAIGGCAGITVGGCGLLYPGTVGTFKTGAIVSTAYGCSVNGVKSSAIVLASGCGACCFSIPTATAGCFGTFYPKD